MGDVAFGTRAKPGQQVTIDQAFVNANPFQLVPATGYRVSIEIQNKSVATIYINTTNAVAANNSIALQPATGGNLGDGGVIQFDLGPSQTLWAVATALPARLCITELVGT